MTAGLYGVKIHSNKANDGRGIHFKVKCMHISDVSTSLTLQMSVLCDGLQVPLTAARRRCLLNLFDSAHIELRPNHGPNAKEIHHLVVEIVQYMHQG